MNSYFKISTGNNSTRKFRQLKEASKGDTPPNTRKTLTLLFETSVKYLVVTYRNDERGSSFPVIVLSDLGVQQTAFAVS